MSLWERRTSASYSNPTPVLAPYSRSIAYAAIWRTRKCTATSSAGSRASYRTFMLPVLLLGRLWLSAFEGGWWLWAIQLLVCVPSVFFSRLLSLCAVGVLAEFECACVLRRPAHSWPVLYSQSARVYLLARHMDGFRLVSSCPCVSARLPYR